MNAYNMSDEEIIKMLKKQALKIKLEENIVEKIKDDEENLNNEEFNMLNTYTKNRLQIKDILLYYKNNYTSTLVKGLSSINNLVFIDKNRGMFNKYTFTKDIYISGILLGFTDGIEILNEDSLLRPGQQYEGIVYIIDSSDEKQINKIKRFKLTEIQSYTSKDKVKNNLSKLKIKIKDYNLSGKVWGLSDIKKTLVGNTISDYEIRYGNSLKLGDSYYIIVNHEIENGKKISLKFLLEEIKFIIPNLKGYKLQKDKTIYKNSIVVLKRKDLKYSKKELKVIEVINNSESSRIQKASSNKKLDIIKCITPTNEILRFRAKDLKFIKKLDNDKKEVNKIGNIF